MNELNTVTRSSQFNNVPVLVFEFSSRVNTVKYEK